MKITNIEEADLFITAKFARLNKNDTIEEYRDQVAEKRFYLERCKVTHSVRMNAEEYAEFTHALLTDREWLAGLGGTWTTADVPDVELLVTLVKEHSARSH
jgi:hypothetical protein